MSKAYRKYYVAILGGLAQVAVVLDQALDAGILPASWRPWVVLAVAAATALGVRQVRNAPLLASGGSIPAGPSRGRSTWGDAGTARTLLVTLVGFSLAGLLVAATLLAGPAEAHRRPAEHVRTNGAQVCGGTLLVAFELEQLVGGAWTFRQDDGAAVVQLHHHGNGAAPGGQWETYVPASGGEGHLRLSVVGRPFWDAVRVMHDGIASSPRLPVECAA